MLIQYVDPIHEINTIELKSPATLIAEHVA